jgi:hypothetical protein
LLSEQLTSPQPQQVVSGREIVEQRKTNRHTTSDDDNVIQQNVQ